MPYKIVFFDIDGTLLDEEKQIPTTTKAAVQRLKEKGVITAIATGRAPFHLKPVADVLGIDTFVSFNGSYVVYKGNVVYENHLNPDTLQELEMYARKHKHPLVFLDHRQCYANADQHPHIEASFRDLKLGTPAYAKHDRNNTIYQALLYCEQPEEHLYHGKFAGLKFLRWHRYSMDVLPDGGSKAIGIQKLLDAMGLSPKQAVAFGDGLNDREMLSFVGMGIAMGNAKTEVRQYAKFVTRHVNDSGIYHGLEQIGLL